MNAAMPSSCLRADGPQAQPSALVASQNDVAALFLKHQNIMRSFWKEFTSLPSGSYVVYENLRQDLVDASCLQQKIQSAVAHEIFYPSIRPWSAVGRIPIDEILDKYADADRLLSKVQASPVSNPETCASYAAWGDALDQIFLQEASLVLPEVGPMRLEGLQQRLLQRRAELQDKWDGEWCGKWGESLLWKRQAGAAVSDC